MGVLWDETAYREVLLRFFEDQKRSIVAQIRSAVVAGEIVRAAIGEGQLQILEQLPENIKLQGVTRTGNT